MPERKRPAPTRPGWYQPRDEVDGMLFSLNRTGQWHAHSQNGDVTACTADFAMQSRGLQRVRRDVISPWVYLAIFGSPFVALAAWLVSLIFGGR
jgi:hypothetical protein